MAKVVITIEDAPGDRDVSITASFQFTPDLDVTAPNTMAQTAGLLLHRALNDALRQLDKIGR